MKDFILYTEALALKELGFDEPCFGHYLMKKFYLKKYHKQGNGITLRPTYSQAFRFFRDIGISFHISDYYDEESRKRYGRAFEIFINGIQQSFNYPSSSTVELYYTYPEAELALLRKLIEIVKNKSI